MQEVCLVMKKILPISVNYCANDIAFSVAKKNGLKYYYDAYFNGIVEYDGRKWICQYTKQYLISKDMVEVQVVMVEKPEVPEPYNRDKLLALIENDERKKIVFLEVDLIPITKGR